MIPFRLGGMAILFFLLAACGATPAPSGPPASEAPSDASASVGPTEALRPETTSDTASSPLPTSRPPLGPTASPSPAAPPSPTADCPVPGGNVTFAELGQLPEACLPMDLTIAGWWDMRRGSDLPDGTPFGEVLRERLPAGSDAEGLEYVSWIGVYNDVGVDSVPLQGHWVEVRATIGSDEAHCTWSIRSDEWPSASFPPTLVCPVFARIISAKRTDPPADALAGCPDPSKVIRVENFVRFPRDCFGGRTVRVAGWFDTKFIIGGWEAPWVIEPDWLWSNRIGRVAVLAQWSDATDPEALELHLRPGSAIAGEPQNRWVVLRGHYAREAEYGTCHYAWFGDAKDFGGRLTEADARADCAQAFVAESVRDGEPG